MFFPLYTEVAPPIYVPTTSFKLMALWSIIVEEAFLSKSASVIMKQTSHPKRRRRKLKSIIMHREKSSTSQIFLYFHRLIGEIAIRKDFPLKFFHKKAFP